MHALWAEALSCRKCKYLSPVLGWHLLKCAFTFFKTSFSKKVPMMVLPFGTGSCITGPLLSKKITYNTYLTVHCLLAILWGTTLLVAHTLLEHLPFGSKSYTYDVSLSVTKSLRFFAVFRKHFKKHLRREISSIHLSTNVVSILHLFF